MHTFMPYFIAFVILDIELLKYEPKLKPSPISVVGDVVE